MSIRPFSVRTPFLWCLLVFCGLTPAVSAEAYDTKPVPPAKISPVDLSKLSQFKGKLSSEESEKKEGTQRRPAKRPQTGPMAQRSIPFPLREATLVPSGFARSVAKTRTASNGTATESLHPMSGATPEVDSREPPDQALCVGSGYIVAAVNTAIQVYNAKSLNRRHGPFRLEKFFNLPPTVTGDGDYILSDPICSYDASAKRFYVAATVAVPESALYYLALSVSERSTAVRWTTALVENSGKQFSQSLDVCSEGCLGDYPTGPGFDLHNIWVSHNMYEGEGGYETGTLVVALRKAAWFNEKAVKGTYWYEAPDLISGKGLRTLQPVKACGNCGFGVMKEYGGTMFMQGIECDVWECFSTKLLTFTNTKKVGIAGYKNMKWRITKVSNAFPLDSPEQKGIPGFPTITQPRLKNHLLLPGARYYQATWDGTKYWTATHTWLAAEGSMGIMWMAVQPNVTGKGPKHVTVATRIKNSGTLYHKKNHFLFPAIVSNSNGKTGMVISVVGKDLKKGQTYTMAWATDIATRVAPKTRFSYYQSSEPLYGCPGVTTVGTISDCITGTRAGDYAAAAVDEKGVMWVASEVVLPRFSSKECPVPLCGPAKLDRVKCPMICRYNWSTLIKKLV